MLQEELDQLRDENERLISSLSRASANASARDAAEQTVVILQAENKRWVGIVS
jgi:hypothetical protein